ncbi:hypothetical protein ABZ471_36645 [Streptomyces sp. NPDC005728]|uniref:hypothetical protein n=1 Tax=Streptomyces sp. NPDC005728 TaxID=3157054 RepID=UPI0033F9B58C
MVRQCHEELGIEAAHRRSHSSTPGVCSAHTGIVTSSRPLGIGRETNQQRNAVEACIHRIGQWRGIATRSEETAAA